MYLCFLIGIFSVLFRSTFSRILLFSVASSYTCSLFRTSFMFCSFVICDVQRVFLYVIELWLCTTMGRGDKKSCLIIQREWATKSERPSRLPFDAGCALHFYEIPLNERFATSKKCLQCTLDQLSLGPLCNCTSANKFLVLHNNYRSTLTWCSWCRH